MRPKRSRTSAYSPRTAPSSVTSATMAWSTSGVGRTSTPTTRAPSARRRALVAAPMPPAAPVTTDDLAVHPPGHQLPSVAMKIVLTSV